MSEPDDEIEHNDMCQWSIEGEGNFFFPTGRVGKVMPSGIYDIGESMRGPFFQVHVSETDELIELPDTQSSRILSLVKEFWQSEDKFRKYGYMWKRGIMLYGPPGSGKTSTINLVSNHITNEMDGIVFYVDNPAEAVNAISAFRAIEPVRPLVVIIEDIDSMLRMEGALLALLDGECQVDNVMFIATTNHPEKLPARLINRPSRFDVVEQIGMPSAAARQIYIESVVARVGETLDNIDEWVAKTKGMGVAHIKDVIISVNVFDLSLDEAVARMRRMIDGTILSDFYDEDEVSGEDDMEYVTVSGNTASLSMDGAVAQVMQYIENGEEVPDRIVKRLIHEAK